MDELLVVADWTKDSSDGVPHTLLEERRNGSSRGEEEAFMHCREASSWLHVLWRGV